MSLIDRATLHLLQHQAGLMATALHANPKRIDRKAADQVQRNVDDILDRRPRPIAVTADGEVLFGHISPWIAAQALPSGLATVINDTPRTEPVLAKPVDPPEPNGGGLGLLDRPAPLEQPEIVRDAEPGGSAKLPPVTNADVDQAKRDLGL